MSPLTWTSLVLRVHEAVRVAVSLTHLALQLDNLGLLLGDQRLQLQDLRVRQRRRSHHVRLLRE